jgi:hypothetical protein
LWGSYLDLFARVWAWSPCGAVAVVAVRRLGLPGGPASRDAFVPGQQKRAKFPTSKAPISAVFYSFWLIFGRAIISRDGLEAWMLFPERARAEHSR